MKKKPQKSKENKLSKHQSKNKQPEVLKNEEDRNQLKTVTLRKNKKGKAKGGSCDSDSNDDKHNADVEGQSSDSEDDRADRNLKEMKCKTKKKSKRARKLREPMKRLKIKKESDVGDKVHQGVNELEDKDASQQQKEKDKLSHLEHVPAPEHLSVDEILNPLIKTDNVEHRNELHVGNSTKEKTVIPEQVALDDKLNKSTEDDKVENDNTAVCWNKGKDMYLPNDANQSVEPETVEHGTDLDAGDSTKQDNKKHNNSEYSVAGDLDRCEDQNYSDYEYLYDLHAWNKTNEYIQRPVKRCLDIDLSSSAETKKAEISNVIVKKNVNDNAMSKEERQVEHLDKKGTNSAKDNYEVQSKRRKVLDDGDEPCVHKKKSQSDEEGNDRDVANEEEERQVEGLDEQEKNEEEKSQVLDDGDDPCVHKKKCQSDEERNNRDVANEEEKRQVEGFDEQETNCAKDDYEVESNNEIKKCETNEEKKSQVLDEGDEPCVHKKKSQSDEEGNHRGVANEEEERQIQGLDEQETNSAKDNYEVQSNHEVNKCETNEEKESQVLEDGNEPCVHKKKSQSDEERNHSDVAKEEDQKHDNGSVGDIKLGKNDGEHVTDSESDESCEIEWKIVIPRKTKSHKEYESKDDVPLALLKRDIYMGCINSTIDSEKELDVKESDVNKIMDTERNNQSM